MMFFLPFLQSQSYHNEHGADTESNLCFIKSEAPPACVPSTSIAPYTSSRGRLGVLEMIVKGQYVAFWFCAKSRNGMSLAAWISARSCLYNIDSSRNSREFHDATPQSRFDYDEEMMAEDFKMLHSHRNSWTPSVPAHALGKFPAVHVLYSLLLARITRCRSINSALRSHRLELFPSHISRTIKIRYAKRWYSPRFLLLICFPYDMGRDSFVFCYSRCSPKHFKSGDYRFMVSQWAPQRSYGLE